MNTKKQFKSLKIFALCALMFSVFSTADAAVVSRTNSRRPAASTSRMPTMAVRLESETKNQSTSETTTPTYDEPTYEEPTPEIIEQVEEETIIEDKTSQFDEVLDDISSSGDDGSTSLADKIRAQRAALDAQDKISTASQQIQSAMASGKNACDQNLRACMQEKCGKDYSKCAGDTDTLWGDKMDACRRDLPCTGEEYRLFATEIKADRDMNARIAGYNSIIECGNTYNECIFTECGTTFAKCLGKTAGDKAIQKCEKIAKNCREQDSGLSARMMSAFGAVRQDAERAVQRDEKRLYELRDAMASTCKRLGAMFDERTLDCVYTVNFYAGEKNTLYASKKAYAGGTFSCDQNWFGVDITTFKENAFRATREQSSATSALMGAGVGTAVGSITSGAIDRAIDRSKAEKALKKAQDEHEETYGKDKSDKETEGTEDSDNTDKKPLLEQKATKKAKKDAESNNKPSDDSPITVQDVQNSMKKDPMSGLKMNLQAPQTNPSYKPTNINTTFNTELPKTLSGMTGQSMGGIGSYTSGTSSSVTSTGGSTSSSTTNGGGTHTIHPAEK